jgi:hypothetical protein
VKICSVEGCERKHRSKGFCNMHYQRFLNHGDPLIVHQHPVGCKVDGCEKKHKSNGYCSMHVSRIQRRGTLELTREKRGAALQWIIDHSKYDGDDCIAYPFGKYPNGYGYARYNGKSIVASRLMCMIAHGPPDNDELFALHSCGNGHLACMNPKHLRWGDQLENMSDAQKHGRLTGGKFKCLP